MGSSFDYSTRGKDVGGKACSKLGPLNTNHQTRLCLLQKTCQPSILKKRKRFQCKTQIEGTKRTPKSTLCAKKNLQRWSPFTPHALSCAHSIKQSRQNSHTLACINAKYVACTQHRYHAV
ncbi:MAG TPA: hypothetical protein DCE42_08715 [Myxococcales bacterium]|nr:hypothetical protein [Myxococcales bacterium]